MAQAPARAPPCQCARGIRGDRRASLERVTSGNERNDATAEAAAGETRPGDAVRRLRQFDEQIDLWRGDLEIVAHRAVRRIHQCARRRHISADERRAHLQHALVLGEDMPYPSVQRRRQTSCDRSRSNGVAKGCHAKPLRGVLALAPAHPVLPTGVFVRNPRVDDQQLDIRWNGYALMAQRARVNEQRSIGRRQARRHLIHHADRHTDEFGFRRVRQPRDLHCVESQAEALVDGPNHRHLQ